MESKVIDRRMIREATLGLLVLTVLLVVLFVTIYLKARVLWATTDEDFLATPVTVYHIGHGNVLTPTKKPPLVPLPAIESNQMVDLGEMRTIPVERFADLVSGGNRPGGIRVATLDGEALGGMVTDGPVTDGPGTDGPGTGGPGTGNFLEPHDADGPGTDGPGTGSFPITHDASTGSEGVEPAEATSSSERNSPTGSTRPEIPSLRGLPEVREIPDRGSSNVKPLEFPTLAPEYRMPQFPNAGLPSAGLPSAGLPSAGLPSASQPKGLPSADLQDPDPVVPSEPVPSEPGARERGGAPGLNSNSPFPGSGILPGASLPVPDDDRPGTNLPVPADDRPDANLPIAEDDLGSERDWLLGDSPIRNVPHSNPPRSNPGPIGGPAARSHVVRVHAELDQVAPELGVADHEPKLNSHSRPTKDQRELPVPPSFTLDDLKNSLRRVGLPPDMSMQLLSERLYGDPRYALALMQLNHRRASSDGQFIPGTQIHYLPAEMLAFVYPDLVEVGFRSNPSGAPSPERPGDTSPGHSGPGGTRLVQPVAFQEPAEENMASSRTLNQAPATEWYVTQGGETIFEIAADHLDQASHYVELMQWNQSLLVGRYRPTDPLPKGLRLRLRP